MDSRATAGWVVGAVVVVAAMAAIQQTYGNERRPTIPEHRRDSRGADRDVRAYANRLIRQGERTFRYDTLGSEAFWGGQLELHRAISAAVSPNVALSVGIKVDIEAVSARLRNQLRRGEVDLDSPASTLALLRENAVVGLTGFFNSNDELSSVGIQCALCHTVVDDSFAPGIGRRLDGYANRDLNVGAIMALAPNLRPIADALEVDQDTVRAVLGTWGPGKFDAELLLDGKALRPDGTAAATLIPPAYGLAGVNLHTWTGWGAVTHWNALVANLEMGGSGTFYDPRLNDAEKFPVAARLGSGNVRNTPDLISGKLAALHLYQLSLPAPRPPRGSFNPLSAERGKYVFSGKADCARCHVPPLFTEPGWNMHYPDEIGIDDFQANRGPDGAYRTAPLKGLWAHSKGGYYHDGRFATLSDVVNHYNQFFELGLTGTEKNDLIEYLKSL